MEELMILCSAIGPDGLFYVANTGRGEDRSPSFHFENLSPEAATLAVTLDDVSHPLFRNFSHWVLWNVPAMSDIPGDLPRSRVLSELGGARQGLAYRKYRYAGPKPPKGHRHVYRFTVYSLDAELDVPWPGTREQFLDAAAGHILQQGHVDGLFE